MESLIEKFEMARSAMMNGIAISFGGFFLGLAGAWFMSRYAYKLELLDLPNERSSHSKPTPRGGGIGILAAFTLSSVFLEVSISIWLPASILAAISFFDDRMGLSPKVRLIAQFVAAVLVVEGIVAADKSFMFRFLQIFFWSFFIVATTNFFNFMDGINGIAGITGAIGFLLVSYFGYLNGASQVAIILSCCLASACLGFLPFNLPIAKVFLGDIGSVLLGFAFSIMVIWLSKCFADFICLITFMFPFYADSLTTLFIRLRNGEKLTQAHRRHLYQVLANEFAHPHWKVSIGYGGVQFLSGLLMIFAMHVGFIWQIFVFIMISLSYYIIMSRLRRIAGTISDDSS